MNKLKIIEKNINEALVDFVKDFKKIGDYSEFESGGVVHIPKLNSVHNDNYIEVKDYKFEKIEEYKVIVPVGVAAIPRMLKDGFSFTLSFIMGTQQLWHKYGFPPEEYHYGDYIKKVKVKELKDRGYILVGYKFEFIGNAKSVFYNERAEDWAKKIKEKKCRC